ncbi:DUF4398 domain-containing protein [Pendulispora rubella]|uniref:DUF4398 domain-containing protein n=1 Tax=Pendulispora rubella TaxID=2741070 RepID=A0ABZ2L5R5_9BACT
MLRTTVLVLGVTLAACASYPTPTARMNETVMTAKAAQEAGAQTNPRAQLHLRLANDQIERAKRLIADGDTKRADYVLVRAKADADLALAEAREASAQRQALAAKQRVDALVASMQENVPGSNTSPNDKPLPATFPTSTPAGTTTTTGTNVQGPVQQPPPPQTLPFQPPNGPQPGGKR